MFETMAAFAMVEHLHGHIFEPPLGAAGYPRTLSPARRPYATLDGHLAVLPFTDAHWAAMARLAGRPELAADARFASVALRLENVDALYAELAAVLATRSSAEWLAEMDRADIPAMPVNGPDELRQDRHLEAVGFWQLRDHESEGSLRMTDVPVGMSRSPGSIRRLAPRLGQHSIEVLREAGLPEPEITAMIESGATDQDEA